MSTQAGPIGKPYPVGGAGGRRSSSLTSPALVAWRHSFNLFLEDQTSRHIMVLHGVEGDSLHHHRVILPKEASHATQGCGFHKLSGALLTLHPKWPDASSLFDYQPISLTHLLAKLFAKVLSPWLAPRLGATVSANQSAFIMGHNMEDNFMLVQQTVR